MARWLQEVAVADSLDAGLDRHGAWIIRRVTAEVDALPRFAERLTVRTWCSGLAKSIAELHGGRISVTSALGEGSMFRVEFPAP